MHLLYQSGILFYFVMEGPFLPLVFTGLSFVLTFIGAACHRATRWEIKYGEPGNQSESKKRRYKWLNATFIVLLTGLPAMVVPLLSLRPYDSYSFDVGTWIILPCMNLPGIVYFVQAVNIRPRKGFKFELPRYL